MASHTAKTSQHYTSTAGAADDVTLSGQFRSVEVVNRDGADAIYFRVGTSAGAVVAPAAAEEDDTYVVPASAGAALTVPVPGSKDTDATVVKTFTVAATKVTVQGVAG